MTRLALICAAALLTLGLATGAGPAAGASGDSAQPRVVGGDDHLHSDLPAGRPPWSAREEDSDFQPPVLRRRPGHPTDRPHRRPLRLRHRSGLRQRRGRLLNDRVGRRRDPENRSRRCRTWSSAARSFRRGTARAALRTLPIRATTTRDFNRAERRAKQRRRLPGARPACSRQTQIKIAATAESRRLDAGRLRRRRRGWGRHEPGRVQERHASGAEAFRSSPTRAARRPTAATSTRATHGLRRLSRAAGWTPARATAAARSRRRSRPARWTARPTGSSGLDQLGPRLRPAPASPASIRASPSRRCEPRSRRRSTNARGGERISARRSRSIGDGTGTPRGGITFPPPTPSSGSRTVAGRVQPPPAAGSDPYKKCRKIFEEEEEEEEVQPEGEGESLIPVACGRRDGRDLLSSCVGGGAGGGGAGQAGQRRDRARRRWRPSGFAGAGRGRSPGRR